MEIVLDDFPTPHYEVIYLVKRKKANMVVAKNQTTGYIYICVKLNYFYEPIWLLLRPCNLIKFITTVTVKGFWNPHNLGKGLVIYNLLY